MYRNKVYRAIVLHYTWGFRSQAFTGFLPPDPAGGSPPAPPCAGSRVVRIDPLRFLAGYVVQGD